MQQVKCTERYYSLPPLEWSGIPRFAVLAGPNGVGKSHLLRLLASAIGLDGAGATPPYFTPGLVEIDGAQFMARRKTHGAYLPALFKLAEVSVDYRMFDSVANLVDDAHRLSRSEPAVFEQKANAFFDMHRLSPSHAGTRDQAVHALRIAGEGLTHLDVFERLQADDFVWRFAARQD